MREKRKEKNDPRLPKTLIDTNVIGDWLIISMKIKQLKNKGKDEDEIEEELKEIWEKYGKSRAAFELLEKIRESSAPQKKFMMCDFSSAELFNVLKQEFIYKKLDDLKVPFSYWFKESIVSKIKFSKKDESDILDEIIEFFKIFFERKKMAFVELSLGADISVMFNLIFRDRCHVTDAVLISTAIANSCEYFVTQDEKLIRKLKKKKEIKVISPQEYLSKFGNLVKKP